MIVEIDPRNDPLTLSPVGERALYKRFAKVALDNLNTSRERYGTYSLEFVMAATYVLDVIADAKESKRKPKDRSTNQNIKTLFDLDEIIDSFRILSATTRKIFMEYIDFNVSCDDEEDETAD